MGKPKRCMPNHPNRSKRASGPVRAPSPADVVLLRSLVERTRDAGITDAQRYCAKQLHTSLRAWQQWERGERRMHPAFYELARIRLELE